MEDIPLYVGKRKNILVLSGGGIKGLGTLGALQYLIEQEIVIKPDILCGTSVGSIICFLLNIGYNPQDIYNVLEAIDFNELYKCDIDELFDDVCFGFNSTDNIIFILYMFLKKKNIKKNITFKELYDMTKTKLIITGTCVNDASIHYFSFDSAPNMEVLKALRISISIPFFCKPCKYDNKVWIDGACINNYPIELYADRLNDVIGVLIDDNNDYVEEFEELDKYILSVLKCLCRGLWVNKYEIFKNQTIKLTTFCDTNSCEFTTEVKKRLFADGYESAKKFYSGK